MYSKLTGNHKETDFAGKKCEYLLLLRFTSNLLEKVPQRRPLPVFMTGRPLLKKERMMFAFCHTSAWLSRSYHYYMFQTRLIQPTVLVLFWFEKDTLDLLPLVLWSLYTNHHPSEEFPRTWVVSWAGRCPRYYWFLACPGKLWLFQLN